jgi:hypothetical protein
MCTALFQYHFVIALKLISLLYHFDPHTIAIVCTHLLLVGDESGQSSARSAGGRTAHVGARQHSRRATHDPPV